MDDVQFHTFYLCIKLIMQSIEDYVTFALILKAVGFEGDVRKQEDAKRVVESTFKHFGRLDILVNAAAGNFLVSAEDLSPNGFRTGRFLILITIRFIFTFLLSCLKQKLEASSTIYLMELRCIRVKS